MSQQIPLVKHKVALVDDDVYEQLKQYNWFLSVTGYAVGFKPVDSKFQLIYMHCF